MEIESLKALFAARLQAWEASPKGHASGFVFEWSFDQMWTELEKKLLEQRAASSPAPSKKTQMPEYGEVAIPGSYLLSQVGCGFGIGSCMQYLGCMKRENSWRKAKLAHVFQARDCVRLCGEDEHGWIRESQYTVHTGGYNVFLEKFEYHVHSPKRPVIVANIAPWFSDLTESYYSDLLQIFNFYHATQHHWAFEWERFKDELGHKKWTKAKILLLLEDRINELPEELQSMHRYCHLTAEKAWMSLIQYYESHRQRIGYKTYFDQRLKIGSRPIESAHCEVLQEWFKLSGQLWAYACQQAVANLTQS